MKIPKATILGAGNADAFNYLIVRKNKHFFPWLKTFFEMAFGYGGMVDVKYSDYKEGEDIDTVEKKVEDFVDRHESYTGATREHIHQTGTRIDIFYGKDKVFIVILTNPENRQRFLKVLKKISVWKK
ncbi:MAG: hypothetical protein HYW25_01420 [Candidatus Aenigmarchaeota archaeon]|nr:hypothetical protein [Candidatus Aenigmarchaeota archaeon]